MGMGNQIRAQVSNDMLLLPVYLTSQVFQLVKAGEHSIEAGQKEVASSSSGCAFCKFCPKCWEWWCQECNLCHSGCAVWYQEPCHKCKTCKGCFRCTEQCTQGGFCGRKCGERYKLPETLPWVWSG